jgi:hypothetical protein
VRTLRRYKLDLCRDCGSWPVATIHFQPFRFEGRWVSGRPASRCARCLDKHCIREKRRRTLQRSMAGCGNHRFTSRSGRYARRVKGARRAHRTILAKGRVLCAEASEARARKLAINKLQKKEERGRDFPGGRVGHTKASNDYRDAG